MRKSAVILELVPGPLPSPREPPANCGIEKNIPGSVLQYESRTSPRSLKKKNYRKK